MTDELMNRLLDEFANAVLARERASHDDKAHQRAEREARASIIALYRLTENRRAP